MKKKFFSLGIALVLFAFAANFAFAETVTVTVENRSSHWVNIAWSPDYEPQLLAAGSTRSFEVPIGAEWSYTDNRFVYYDANEDNTIIIFYDL